MRWRRYGICLRLAEPIHIGYQPSRLRVTVTARSRPYVPGKTVWGALTVALAHCLSDGAPGPDDYRQVGALLRDHARSSHLFVCDADTYYAPAYRCGAGENPRSVLLGDPLCFGPVLADGPAATDVISAQVFRRRFMGSRMAAKIDAATGAAEDAMLHETEFILARERGRLPMVDVRVAGCIWLDDDALTSLQLRQEGDWLLAVGTPNAQPLATGLLLGGDRTYGFGATELAPPNTGATRLLSHLPADPDAVALANERPLAAPLVGYSGAFVGEKEYLVHRTTVPGSDRPGGQLEGGNACLAVGSLILGDGITARIGGDGLLEAV